MLLYKDSAKNDLKEHSRQKSDELIDKLIIPPSSLLNNDSFNQDIETQYDEKPNEKRQKLKRLNRKILMNEIEAKR